MSLFTFLKSSPRFLVFGLFTAFFSSFGQTFFISLSGADIRDTFGLSHGDFGLLYSSATLASAGLLIWAGRKIDDLDLRTYTSFVCVGLAVACLGMSAANQAWLLIPVIFGLRFFGQGLMSHISSVSMARYFDANRGKALSLASLGYPTGEALLPTIVVALIATVGWRQMWAGFGILLLLALVPFMRLLLKGHDERHSELKAREISDNSRRRLSGWSRRQVLRDPRFYALLPSYLAMSFIGTGFFFHQVHLTETKGWELSIFVGFFVLYAATQILSSLITGFLVDRFNARRVMQVYLLPVLIGLGFIIYSDAVWAGAAFMSFMGMTSGAVGVVHGAIWAEIYGLAHLGAIKALGTSLMVLSTALSPPMMGLAIDQGITMETLALYCIGYIVFSAVLVNGISTKLLNNQPPD